MPKIKFNDTKGKKKSNITIENFLTTDVSLTSLLITKGMHHTHHTENYNINFLIGTLTIVKKPNRLIRSKLVLMRSCYTSTNNCFKLSTASVKKKTKKGFQQLIVTT